MAKEIKQTKGADDFKNYINGPTKKDPRKSNSYEHDKAFEGLKDQSTPPKTKISGKKKF